MAVSAGTINIRTLPCHMPCDRGSSRAGIWPQPQHHPPPPSSRYSSKVILDRQTAPVMLEGHPRRRLLAFSDRTVDHYQIPILAYVLCFVLRHFSERCCFVSFPSSNPLGGPLHTMVDSWEVHQSCITQDREASRLWKWVENIDISAIRFYIIRRSTGPRSLEVRLGLPTPHSYRGICPSLFRYCVSAGTVDKVERQRRSRHLACWLNLDTTTSPPTEVGKGVEAVHAPRIRPGRIQGGGSVVS